MICNNCDLCISRKNVVLGVGNKTADIMLVGEAPGYYEDKEGKPFVGDSGKYLHSIIDGLFKDDVYITNVVKCRPPNNRDPYQSEIHKCVNTILSKEIPYVNPIFIITLGKIATDTITGTANTMSKVVGSNINVGTRMVFPMYHPSFILRNEHMKDEYRDTFNSIAGIIRRIQSINAIELGAVFNKNKEIPF